MKCPICSNNKNFKRLKPTLCQSDNYLCSKCGLVFIPKRYVSVKNYYKEGGYFKKSPNIACRKQLVSRSLLVKIAKERIKDALEIFPVDLGKKTILDVGCGYGEILYCLKKDYGTEVFGIEPSSETATIGNQMFSVPIQPVLLEELNTKSKFDIIWCSHVLEHVYDVRAFIKRIKKLLAKDGYIYIEVPSILNPSGGFNLDMFLYKEHLQTFSAYNLYLLLMKYKLNVVSFSDQNFLRFWCQTSGKKYVRPEVISAEDVLEFLKRYKSEYNIIDFVKVYSQKFLYGVRLVIYKIIDLL